MFITAAKLIGAGLATIALGGAGVGIGTVFGAFQLALSRNPALLATLFRYAILGFALTEAIALLGLMMAFLILFAFLWNCRPGIGEGGSEESPRSAPCRL